MASLKRFAKSLIPKPLRHKLLDNIKLPPQMEDQPMNDVFLRHVHQSALRETADDRPSQAGGRDHQAGGGPQGKLAIYSPLPPSRSGVSDYVAELSPYLERHFDIVHVIADDAPRPAVSCDHLAIVRESEFHRQATKEGDDYVRLYHMGNSPYHAYIYEAARKRPGFVVLHDFMLHHLVGWLYLRDNRDPAHYLKLLESGYGIAGSQYGVRRLRGQASEFEQFFFPLNEEVLEGAQGVLVHSYHSQNKLAARRPDLPTARIPMPVAEYPAGFQCDSQAAARKRLSIGEDTLVLASMGFVTEPKCTDVCLRALASIRSQIPQFEYWIIGEQNPHCDLQPLIRELGLDGVIHFTGFVELETFHDYLQASDIVVNLRYPSAGETSASLVRALGMGRPAVVYGYDSYLDYPDSVVCKVPLDTQDTRGLEQVLRRLATDHDYRREVGMAAARFVETEHAAQRSATAYANFINALAVTHGSRSAA